MKRLSNALCLAALFGAAGAAHAQQQGFALDSYDPVAPGAEWFANDSLDFRGEHKLGVGLTTAWAHKPLVLYSPAGAPLDSLVRDQVTTHLGVQFLYLSRARLSIDVPVALYQGGDAASVQGVDFPSPTHGSLADPRVSADVRLLGGYRELISLALGGEVHIPVGSRAQYTGDGRVRIGAHARAAGEWRDLSWSGAFGWEYRRLRDQYAGLQHDNVISLDLALGVRALEEKLLVGPELHLATQLGYSHSAFDRETTPAELLFGAHYRLADQLDVGLGAGPGLTQGVGSPAFRALFQLAWMPREASSTARLEQSASAPREAAQCPEIPKPAPPPPPPPAPICPALPPAPPPPPAPLPKPPPTVKKVVVIGDQIRIPHQIAFKNDSAILAKSNESLLQAVLAVVVEHQEIAHLRIEGHTNNVGTPEHNLALSKARAKSVMAWLVAHGVPVERLTSRGYGETRPLVANDTPANQARNRRVEFHILSAEEAAQDRAAAAEEAARPVPHKP